MKALNEKFLRSNMERIIVQHYKNIYPHFEFEQNARKVPLYPKIVVYSNVASVDKFLEQYLSQYLEFCQPTKSKESNHLLKVMISSLIESLKISLIQIWITKTPMDIYCKDSHSIQLKPSF